MIRLLAAAGVALAAASGVTVDRTVADPRIRESSGLAVSPQHPGVLWTHDDSGNPPLLFALTTSGAVAATVRIRGVPDVDWEAMAAFRDAAGRPLLAAADIGDNAAEREHVEVDVVPEPAALRPEQAAPLLRLVLTYPDGAHDAETLIVDTARRRMFVVTKGLFSSRVYVVPPAGWDGTAPRTPQVRTARLVPVGTVRLVLVTDGTVAPSGVVLLRTYTELAVLDPFPLEAGDALLRPRASTGLPAQRQGEGLALVPGGRAVLLSSEGVDQPLLRADLPAGVAGAVAAGPSPSASSSASPSGSPSGSASGSAPAPGPDSAQQQTAGGGTPFRWPLLVTLGLVLAAAALALARRPRP